MYSFSTTTTRSDATTRVFPILSLSFSLPNRSSRFSLSIYIYDTLYIYEELSLFAQTRFSKAANNTNEDVKCFPKTPWGVLCSNCHFSEKFFLKTPQANNNTLVGKRRHATRRIERERERERENKCLLRKRRRRRKRTTRGRALDATIQATVRREQRE